MLGAGCISVREVREAAALVVHEDDPERWILASEVDANPRRDRGDYRHDARDGEPPVLRIQEETAYAIQGCDSGDSQPRWAAEDHTVLASRARTCWRWSVLAQSKQNDAVGVLGGRRQFQNDGVVVWSEVARLVVE